MKCLPIPLRTVALPILLAHWLAGGSAWAADPQPYKVTLKPTDNSALDQALHDASQLVSLRENAPVGPFALVTRARQDAGRFQSALNSFGDYKGRVTITIAGRQLDDPGLLDLLDQAPADPPVEVLAEFDPGPQFHLGRVTIDGDVPPDVRDKLGLAPGAPAIAADVLAAQGRLLTALREAGHPLATVDLPPVTLQPADNTLNVTFRVAAGPYADIGPITITGLKSMNEEYVRRRLLLQQGQRFSPTAIEKARADLSAIGVFSVVRIEPADHLDPDGTIPIAIDVTERPLHSVDVGAAYSTDLGINANVGWHHRNLFGNAEQLNLTAGVELGGSAVQHPGYNVAAQFIKPDFLTRDQSLELELRALKQDLDAYDQEALIQRIAISRKFLPHWTVGVGVTGEQERIVQEGVTTNYELIGLPLSAKYDDTNSLLDPDRRVPCRGPAHAHPVLRRLERDVRHRAGLRFHLFRPERLGAQRGGAARTGGQGVRRRRVQPAARPALLRRWVGHRARLPLPVGRTAVPRRQADRRHGGQRRIGRVPPADSRQLWRGGVRRCRPGHRERLAVHRRLAGRRGHRRAVLHLDRPNSSRCRSAIEPGAGRRRFRAVYRDRTSLLMRRAAKWIGWTLSTLVGLPILLILVVLIGANTGAGRHAIERLTPKLTGDTVRLAGISGRFPDGLRIARVALRDPQGDYATIEDFALDWSPSQLLHRQIVVDRLAAARVDVARQPAGSSSGGSYSLPAPVVLRELRIDRVDIAAPVAGTPVSVALDGSGALQTLTQGRVALNIRQLDGAGSYTLDGAMDAGGLHATLKATEPAHGMVAGIAGLPDLGAIDLAAKLDGPQDAVATHVTVSAGPLHAAADGTLDLEHAAADITLSASAPAMRPRPDIGWQAVTLDAHVKGPFAQPDATGRLHIDALAAAGITVASITASVSGNAGQVHLDGEVLGLHVPAPNPDLFAGDPIIVQRRCKVGRAGSPGARGAAPQAGRG